MTEDEYHAFVQRSCDYLQEQQDTCRMDWGIGSFAHVEVDREAAEMVFRNARGPRVVCPMQITGTYCHDSRTWRWSWDDPSVGDRLREAATITRRFGQEHGVPELTAGRWEADEADAWAMTAVAANLVQARGAYRDGGENGLFMLMMDLRREP